MSLWCIFRLSSGTVRTGAREDHTAAPVAGFSRERGIRSNLRIPLLKEKNPCLTEDCPERPDGVADFSTGPARSGGLPEDTMLLLEVLS